MIFFHKQETKCFLFMVVGCSCFYVVFIFYNRHLYFYLFYPISKRIFHLGLLLKKGKNPLDCSSYRPISLIPCDLQIYAKVFASRMEKVIHSLIKEDQTGFIKGRNASDNMRRLLHILDFADSHPSPCAVFSQDAEKAFDRLEWQFCNVSALVNTSFL